MPDTTTTTPSPVPGALSETNTEAFRQRIDSFTPSQLMETYRSQQAQLAQKQQVIQEILEDFNSADTNTISKEVRNSIIEELSRGILAENSQLLQSHEQRLSLASHLDTSDNPVLWGVKLQLMEGTFTHMSETFKETSGSTWDKIRAVGRFLIAVLSVLRGGKYTATAPTTSPETTPTVPEAERAIESDPQALRTLNQVELVDSTNVRPNMDAGYVTVSGTPAKLIKFDGSEIKNSRDGEALEESHALKTYLLQNHGKIGNISLMTGKTSNRERVELAMSIVNQQKQENTTATPVDIAQLINDNWRWLVTQSPYSGQTPQQRFDNLTGSGAGAMITAMKTRYERVRTHEVQLNRARRNVRTKLTDATAHIISKMTDSTGPAAMGILNILMTAIDVARSYENPREVYNHAKNTIVILSAQNHVYNNPDLGYGPYGYQADYSSAQEKFTETITFLDQQIAALPQSPST